MWIAFLVEREDHEKHSVANEAGGAKPCLVPDIAVLVDLRGIQIELLSQSEIDAVLGEIEPALPLVPGNHLV